MNDALWQIDETLVAKGFEFVREPMVYQGPLPVHGKAAKVEIAIPDVTFVRMPTVRLLDRSALPVESFAHLNEGSSICYFGSAGLPLDLYDPGGSILRVLIQASEALERSFAGRAAAEFEQELPSYWGGKAVYFDVPRGPQRKLLGAEILPRTDADDSGLIVVPKGAWKDRPGPRLPVTVLNFAADLRHTEKLPLKTVADALRYLEAQPDPPKGWKAAILEATAAGTYIFLAAPNAIVGWSPTYPPALSAIKGRTEGFRPGFFRGAVERGLNTIDIEPKVGAEVGLQFIVERNLAGAPSLVGKRVALIGCGTIGGYLARMLAQSGAGCGAPFVPYDVETLSAGNLGRHLLGFNDIGRNKAAAVAAHLKEFHPDVQIVPRAVDATQDWEALETMDLIVDATGIPNVATAVNHLFQHSERAGAGLALLHTFVFGNGVAAQSFLNLKDGHACYRCLKPDFGADWRHNPLKDPTSPLREAPARCGEGDYVPFSVDAPVAAAALALRAILDWAGAEPGQRLRTAVLDQVAGRAKMRWASPPKLDACPACGSV